MAVIQATPGFDLATKCTEECLLATVTTLLDFDFLNQYLPDTYEKEVRKVW